jgi:hypothetical protein
MGNSSNVDGEHSIRAMTHGPQSREYWPMKRATHMDLTLARLHRANVLLMGPPLLVEDALQRLLSELREPIYTWTAPDPLELPSPEQSGTLILREIGELVPADQQRLAWWLESSAGRTQVISTTASQLVKRVDAGVFLDTLYYRLNVVCVDISA